MLMLSEKYPGSFVKIHSWTGGLSRKRKLYLLRVTMEKVHHNLKEEIK
jgi:hypothetical protein